MSNLIVEIGNTAVKAAWSQRMTLGKTFRYQGEKHIDFILSLIGNEKPLVMVVSSVYEVSAQDRELLAAQCSHLLVLDSNNPELLVKEGLPKYLSYDRAASIIAARYIFNGRGCTIIDFGTTLSIDFITPEGNYLGGNISPGCRTRFKALNRYSKSLPLVDTPSDIAETGNSEVSSIECGVVLGIVFEISAYLDRYGSNIAVFTGGDAKYFASRIKSSVFIINNLVLIGLALIADEYACKVA